MKVRLYWTFLLLFLIYPVQFCLAQEKPVYTLYLIGDGGEPSFINVTYKKNLQAQLQNGMGKQAIVFLGDNIYPKGMPDAGAPGRERAESILKNQIDMVGGGASPVYILPGNHDWKRGKQDGWSYIRNQQQWVDSLKNNNVHFFPQGGCPGPVEIALTDSIVLVILDTQWLLHPWSKPEGSESPCDTKTLLDVMAQLDDILRRNTGKRVVVTAHHPIYTYGEHGGVYTIKQHIFPLTDVKKNAWIPLPVIGSIYPLYRKFFGNIQDVANPNYKQFTSSLKKILHNYPGTIYAAGHEHTLQYSEGDSIHFIVSGAGSKSTPVKKKGHALFAVSEIGYARVAVNSNGSAAIEYFSGDEMIWSKTITPPRPPDTNNAEADDAIQQGTVTAFASNQYTASKEHERWLGKNYRDVWAKKFEMPVFDIGTEHGGLKIIQRGGGYQTLSLRLQDSHGKEFTLRSIEKYPAKAIPEAFRNTFAEDLVQDQISASHPYGAVVVPALAKAAGIYHTNPKIVFIPNDKRFGVYRNEVAGQVMLFEERPSRDGKGMEFFGNAGKIIGIDKLLEKLAKDNDNHVDQEFVLRSRLFDLLIADWDRHDDQWRWAELDDKKGKIYRPIPRDRDQAFFVNEGRIPPVWKRKWLLPKFEGFKDSVRWTPGLMFNARYFDRNFLTALTKDQWIKSADELTARMTDKAIDSALALWPKEVYDIRGEEIARKLRSRRKNLKKYAIEHYLFLAREVTVVGSDKREVFEITHKPNGNVLVEMFKSNSDGKGKLLYSREFIKGETKEVRIHGRGGDDEFRISGEGHRGVLVRMIGGDGKDKAISEASSSKDLMYDLKDGVVLQGSGKIRNRTSADPKVNSWDRLEYVYNTTAPLAYFNSNVDDGLFIGGGALITTQGFRKSPYKNRHLIMGSYALATSSFNFRYDGRFNHLFGNWNLELDADIKSPNYVNNFFGLGNESVFNQHINEQPGVNVEHSIQYYRMRFKQYDFEVKVSRRFGQAGFFRVGPAFQRVGIQDPGNKIRFIKQEYAPTLNEPLFDVGRSYGGITYSWGFDKRNSPLVTTRGIYFQQTSRWMAGLSDNATNFSTHTASLALYQSFRLPARITFAFRASAGKTFGDYQIYQAQILDGRTEIRGFRKTRFYGDSKLVFNNEVRLKLASFHSYAFPASIGLTGFYDVGRVWYKDKNGIDPTASDGKSNLWHKGIGGGIWFTPFSLAVLTVEVAHSEEETLGYLRMGFLF